MRLRLNEKLLKNYFIYSFALIAFSFVFLYCLPLTVHASEISSYPLYYGAGSGYGYPADVDISSVVSAAIQYAGTSLWYGHTPYAVFAYEYNSTSGVFTVCCVYEGSVNFSPNPQSYPNITNVDSLTYGRTIQYFIDVDTSSYSCSWNRAVSFNSVSPSLWLVSDGSGGFYIPTEVTLYGYPLWTDGDIDIYSAGDRLGFICGAPRVPGTGPGLTGEAFGKVTDSEGNESNIDLEFNLSYDDSGVTSRLDELNSSVLEGFGVVGEISGKISDFNDDFNETTEVPTNNQLTSILNDTEVIGSLVAITSEAYTGFSSVFAEPDQVTSSDMVFDLPFHYQIYDYDSGSFVDRVKNVRISFAWYESIRSKVLTVIVVFMCLGFGMYLFRQIPNLINGVSGGASAGQSVSDLGKPTSAHNSKKGGKK